MILALNEGARFERFESRYTDPSGRGFDNEAAKIVQRYVSEAKQAGSQEEAVEARKQVRFEDSIEAVQPGVPEPV